MAAHGAVHDGVGFGGPEGEEHFRELGEGGVGFGVPDGVAVAAVVGFGFGVAVELFDGGDLLTAVVHVVFDLAGDFEDAVEVFFGEQAAVEEVQDLVTSLVKGESPADEDSEDGLFGIAV